MNALWTRAEGLRLLQTVYAVLKHELDDAAHVKRAELRKFNEAANDVQALAEFVRKTGFTKDACERVLSNITEEEKMLVGHDEDVAADTLWGDKALKQLYPGIWTNAAGQKPTDVIVLDRQNPFAVLGDCKFGMISEDSGLLKDSSRLQGDFIDKCKAVGDLIKTRDNVSSSPRVLFVVTSALAPLLRNRIDDYRLDPHYADIPLGDIVFCCAEDIETCLQEIMTRNEVRDRDD